MCVYGGMVEVVEFKLCERFEPMYGLVNPLVILPSAERERHRRSMHSHGPRSIIVFSLSCPGSSEFRGGRLSPRRYAVPTLPSFYDPEI